MKKYFIFVGLLAVNLLVIHSALAQGFLDSNSNPASGFFVNPGHFGGSGQGTVADILKYVLGLMLDLAGFFASLFLILGGYYYMVSGANEELAEKGKRYMTNSVIGFAIIILSWVILKLVQNTLRNGA